MLVYWSEVRERQVRGVKAQEERKRQVRKAEALEERRGQQRKIDAQEGQEREGPGGARRRERGSNARRKR